MNIEIVKNYMTALVYLLQKKKILKRSELIKYIISSELFKSKSLEKFRKNFSKDEVIKYSSLNVSDIECLLKNCNENNIKLTMRGEQHYPKLLNESNDAPLVIFYRGNLEKLNQENLNHLSIVGTRKMSSYGRRFIESEIPKLSLYNFCIISGLARGIDSCAHEVAIANSIFTVGVLAHGIDLIYPKEHRVLRDRIAKAGVLISEHAPGVKPLKPYFPARNRIISALSNYTLVVEAGEKSGSLITAQFAAEQNRNVMTVPGSIYQEVSVGCNSLLKDGALLVRSAKDITNWMNLDVKVYHKDIDFKKEKLNNITSKLICDRLTLSIINLLDKKPFDELELANRLNLNISEILIELTKLESLGYIKRDGAKVFLTKSLN